MKDTGEGEDSGNFGVELWVNMTQACMHLNVPIPLVALRKRENEEEEEEGVRENAARNR